MVSYFEGAKNSGVSYVVWCFVDHVSWYTVLMNQHQLDTLSLVCILRVNVSTCFGHTHPSSGGCAQLLFGVIVCVGCVLTACWLHWNHNQLAVNTHST
jgi:hypothetical protein